MFFYIKNRKPEMTAEMAIYITAIISKNSYFEALKTNKYSIS